MPEENQSSGVDRPTRVFLSYSRSDSSFAEKLRQALIQQGFEAYLDKHDIRPGEPWQERLGGLIARADIVVFCLSPISIRSEICDWEVNEAERLSKRILPVVCVDPDPNDTPGRLKRLNYIFMRGNEEFETGLNQLKDAIATDIDWVNEQTRLMDRALEWSASGKADSLLLRDDQINEAEKWLGEHPTHAPEISGEIRRFIALSRQSQASREKRAKRRLQITTSVSLLVAVTLAILGWHILGQWREQLRFKSLTLADAATSAMQNGDAITARLLALEGLPDRKSTSLAQRLRPFVAESLHALDATTGRAVWIDAVVGHTGLPLRAVTFVPKTAKAVTVSGSQSVTERVARLWDTNDRSQIGLLSGHTDQVLNIAVSPDGRQVLTTSIDKTARLWELETGKPIATLTGHETPVLSAAFSTDGARAVTGAWHSVRLWDLSTGRQLRSFTGHKDDINAVLFLNNGRQIASAAGSPAPLSDDTRVIIWDVRSGEVHRVFDGHKEGVLSLDISPNGKMLVTGSYDDTARLWDIETGREIRILRGHSDNVNSVLFAPNGRFIVTGSADDTIRMWKVKTGEQILVLRPHAPNSINSLDITPDGKLLAGSGDGVIRIWTRNDGQFLKILRGHKRGVRSVAYSPDGALIFTKSSDKTIRVWSTQTFEQLGMLADSGLTGEISISPVDGSLLYTLASRRGRLVKSWDFRKNTKVTLFSSDNKVVHLGGNTYANGLGTLTFLADGTAVTLSVESDRLLHAINSRTKQSISRLEAKVGSKFRSIQPIEKGRVLIIYYDDKAELRELPTGKVVGTFSVPKQIGPEVGRVFDFSEIDPYVLVGITNSLELWNLQLDKKLWKSSDHAGTILAGAFSPDGMRAATVATDGTLRIWEVTTGMQLATFTGHQNWLLSLAFSPDGKAIVTGSEDNTARVWPVNTVQRVVDAQHKSLTRCLSPSQREEFHLKPAPPEWCIKGRKWPYHRSSASHKHGRNWEERLISGYDKLLTLFGLGN